MGSGTFTTDAFKDYSTKVGKVYSMSTGRVSGQVFKETRINQRLMPKNVMRECVDTEEHPNSIPIILGLDVTGSMGDACHETAEALGVIMRDLLQEYSNSKYDLEFCMMGIGDVECDGAPIQMGQFESDVRFAEDLDAIYMEHGGGGNDYESYSAAWYMAAHHTKLDAITKGRRGIIITMGDEPLNPILPARQLREFVGDNVQSNIYTKDLYEEVSKNFDVYHINIEHGYHCRDNSPLWKDIIGQNYIESDVAGLKNAIVDCIKKTLGTEPVISHLTEESGSSSSGMPEISW